LARTCAGGFRLITLVARADASGQGTRHSRDDVKNRREEKPAAS